MCWHTLIEWNRHGSKPHSTTIYKMRIGEVRTILEGQRWIIEQTRLTKNRDAALLNIKTLRHKLLTHKQASKYAKYIQETDSYYKVQDAPIHLLHNPDFIYTWGIGISAAVYSALLYIFSFDTSSNKTEL